MQKAVYLDINSDKSEEELRQVIDIKLIRLTREFRLSLHQSLEIVFDDDLKECMLDVQLFYSLKLEYENTYEI